MSNYDAFISYSTQDAEFVTALRLALELADRRVWQDVKELELTAEWWNQIKQGIFNADNFLFVVSPRSMASPVCHLELEYARSLNKRVIFVRYQTADKSEATRAMVDRILTQDYLKMLTSGRDMFGLAEDNWRAFDAEQSITIRSKDELLTQVPKLIDAFDKDYLYIKQGKLLLTRAQEWKDSERSAGFLLTGAALTSAEKWQETGKHPPPTDLHREYIAASRTAEDENARLKADQERRTRRLRRAARVAALVGVLALISAAAAAVVGANAVNSATLASTQVASANTREAEANAAAATAEGRADDAERREALANAALTAIPPTLDAAATSAADARFDQATAAAAAATAEGRADDAEGRAALANAALTAIPPTLDAVATQVRAGEDRIISLDLASKAVEILNDESGNPEVAALLGIRALRTAYTGQAYAAMVRATNSLYTLAALTGHTDRVTGALTLEDGRLLSWSDDDTLRLWSSAGEPLTTLAGHTSIVTGALALEDGRLLSWSADGTLRLWSSAGEPLTTLAGHTASVYGALALEDGRLLSWSADDTLRLWSSAGEPLTTLTGHTNAVTGALTLEDGRLLSWSWDDTLRLWSSAGEPLTTLAGHTNAVTGALALEDGRLLSWSDDDTLRLWSSAGEPLTTLAGHTDGIRGALALEDGRLLSRSSDYTLRLWSSAGEPLATLAGHTDGIRGALALEDGRLLSWSADGTLRLWDTDYRAFIDYACTRVFRDFMDWERARYGIDGTPTCPQFAGT